MHTSPTRRPLRAGLLIATLALTACGSDDREPLSKADFVGQANAICADFQTAAEPVFERVWADFDEDDPTAEETIFTGWADALDELGPEFDRMLDAIEDLEPPVADREFIETLLADQRTALATFTTMVDDAAAGDVSARRAMEDEDVFDDVDRRATEYGLTTCGDG